jgi:hypothetical protein
VGLGDDLGDLAGRDGRERIHVDGRPMELAHHLDEPAFGGGDRAVAPDDDAQRAERHGGLLFVQHHEIHRVLASIAPAATLSASAGQLCLATSARQRGNGRAARPGAAARCVK